MECYCIFYILFLQVFQCIPTDQVRSFNDLNTYKVRGGKERFVYLSPPQRLPLVEKWRKNGEIEKSSSCIGVKGAFCVKQG